MRSPCVSHHSLVTLIGGKLVENADAFNSVEGEVTCGLHLMIQRP